MPRVDDASGTLPLFLLLAVSIAAAAFFTAAALGFVSPPGRGAVAQPRGHSMTVALPRAGAQLALPPISGPADPARPLVIIDAGHGGEDSGAVATASDDAGVVREKDVTLAIARAIRDRIVKGGLVRVALTRDEDRFLVLQERYELARRMGAGLFLSIHADAAENPDASGATVYTLSETASDRESARLAARENRSDIINGVDLSAESGTVAAILIDLSQRETMTLSSEVADILHREASPFLRFRPQFHRFASLVVLKAPDTPSVLLEAGYMTSADDLARITSDAGREAIAQGVGRAVEVYFARRSAAD